MLCLTACRKEITNVLPLAVRNTQTSCPLPPTGPCRLEGTTLSNLLVSSRNYKHPCLDPHMAVLHTKALHTYGFGRVRILFRRGEVANE